MGTLKVGVGQTSITPDLGCHLVGYFEDRIADNIHDPLYARAIVLSDGKTVLGLITCDIIDLPVRTVLGAKERITAATGVPAENVLISATHTHTGPSAVGALGTPDMPEYAEALKIRIADAFCMAFRAMVPAEAAWCSGDCSGEVHNRRWRMKDGSVRMNPGYQNPDAIEPAGPTDPELGLLIIRSADGSRRPIAVYANLALHYVGSSNGTWVSADYFGEFASALQRIAGTAFMVSMANGCQGNINNCDFTRPARTSTGPYHQITRVANVVAAETWKQWCSLREEDFRQEIVLDSRLVPVPFKARTPTAAELAAARERMATPGNDKDMEWVYARELVLLSEKPSEWEIPIQGLRIGDLGIVGLHGEVFVDVGLDIKSRSLFARTMVIGLANGSVGYVATDKALDEGSYETRLCRHVRAPRGTAGFWADTAEGLLEELHAGH